MKYSDFCQRKYFLLRKYPHSIFGRKLRKNKYSHPVWLCLIVFLFHHKLIFATSVLFGTDDFSFGDLAGDIGITKKQAFKMDLSYF